LLQALAFSFESFSIFYCLFAFTFGAVIKSTIISKTHRSGGVV
jgi:hypothetical protein